MEQVDTFTNDDGEARAQGDADATRMMRETYNDDGDLVSREWFQRKGE